MMDIILLMFVLFLMTWTVYAICGEYLVDSLTYYWREKLAEPKKLYAKRGEVVECLNGHYIAEFNKDAHVGDEIIQTAFHPRLTDWDQNKSHGYIEHSLTHSGLCPTCRAPYMMASRVHIKGETGFRTCQ